MERNANRGFTLIEVLVAMLVIAIGLLGVAALQFRGMQYSKGALIRSQVNILANDITEKVRINSANVSNYVGNWTVPTSAPTGCDPTKAPDASNDLTCWHEEVFNAMPPGSTASITTDGTNYTLTMSWTDRENNTFTVSYPFM